MLRMARLCLHTASGYIGDSYTGYYQGDGKLQKAGQEVPPSPDNDVKKGTVFHRTFFIWNLMVARTVSTLLCRLSPALTSVGNLPALVRPGPSRRGICTGQEWRTKWLCLARRRELGLATGAMMPVTRAATRRERVSSHTAQFRKVAIQVD